MKRSLRFESLEQRQMLAVTVPVELQGMIANPGVGYQTFYQSATNDPNVKAGSLSSKTYYTRVEWSDIEKSVGVYDWSYIDRELAWATAAGQKFCFRIMPFEEGDGGPIAYRNAGFPGYSFSVAGTATWVPDYNDAAVQAQMTQFIVALGQRYGHDSRIDSVDIGMIGRWGEMHYYQCSPTPPLPTAQTWKWLIDTFRDNFSSPLFIGVEPALSSTASFQYAISQGIGWRDDGWADSWEMNVALPQVLAAAPDAWKTSPIYLEPIGTMRDTAAWRSALEWAVANHVSVFSNKSTLIPASLLPAVQDMTAKLGYRFVLKKAENPDTVVAGSQFALSLEWTNKGNAPIYQDRDILVKIGSKVIDLGHSMKGFLPGSRLDTLEISTAGLATGNYTIQIGLAAPGATAPDIALAIQGGVGNWYTVGTVTVISPPLTKTWDGGGTNINWSTPANWSDNAAPQPYDNLVFPSGTARSESINDYPTGTLFSSIVVSGGNYNIQNNPLRGATVEVKGTTTLTTSSIICDTLTIGSFAATTDTAPGVTTAPLAQGVISSLASDLPILKPEEKTAMTSTAESPFIVELPTIQQKPPRNFWLRRGFRLVEDTRLELVTF